MSARRLETAAILATGEELVTGRVVDSNSSWIQRRLRAVGVRTVRSVQIGDVLDEIVRELRAMATDVDLIIVSGGLGPTEDDRTREAIATAFDCPLERSEAGVEDIVAFFGRYNREPSPSNLRQADLPRGATRLRNERGTAPGFRLEDQRATVFAVPGVPSEMQWMVGHYIEPWVDERSGPGWLERSLWVYGVGESIVGEAVATWMKPEIRPEVSITASPSRVCLTLTDVDDAEGRRRVDQRLREIEAAVDSLGRVASQPHLATLVVEVLIDRSETIALAESCTGGMIASVLTDVPGASATVLEGCVAYSNEAKIRSVGVDAATIQQQGAVSEEVARALAEGIRERASATWGIGVTGIAGPGGGTEDKPVGLVHIAVAGPRSTHHRRIVFPGDRRDVRQRTVVTSLQMLLNGMSVGS